MGIGVRSTTLGWLALSLVAAAVPVPAAALPFSTTESSDYLIIANGSLNAIPLHPGVGQAVNTNNFELGANKAPVPSTSDFLDGGSSGGPSLAGNVPDIPSNAAPVFQGISGDGNIAIVSPDGVFNLQDVGVYADPNIGIQCAQGVAGCDDGTQNSFFNDPNQFPNTFDTNTQTGVDVNPNDADQSTRIDEPNSAGVTGNIDFTALIQEVFVDAANEIMNLAQTGVLNTNSGTIDSDTTVNLMSGLNVIDILTSGNDFLLDNANLVIDGPSDAFAIFRVPDDANFLVSQANILIGDGGIGLNNVLFFSKKPDNDQHFNFSSAVLNGVAFWSVARQGGEINIDNAQGCVQLVADKVTLNNVRFTRCAFDPPNVVPVPASTIFLGTGLGILAWSRRKRRGNTACADGN